MRKILCRWANWNDFLLSHLQTEGIWEYGYMWRYNLYYDKYLLKHLRDRKNVLFNRNDSSKKERSDWSQNYTERAFYCYSEDIDTVPVQKFVKVKRLVLCKNYYYYYYYYYYHHYYHHHHHHFFFLHHEIGFLSDFYKTNLLILDLVRSLCRV